MKQLQVGFGRKKITPQVPVPLGGYGNSSRRISQNVLSDIYTTCVAFTGEDGTTVLLYHNDLGNCASTVFPAARQTIADAVGLPVEHVMLCCTHTHSAPDLHSDLPSIVQFRPWLVEQFIAAAQDALADRKNATMSIAFTKTKSLNFVRHYIMNDGSYVGDNFGTTEGKTYVSHTTQADPEMRLIKFTREGGKDILLCNWQTHPHRTGGGKKFDLSADIVGAMRDIMEEKTDCLFAYYSGGSGNINPSSRIKEENITADYLEQGQAMAEYALNALDKLSPVNNGSVQILPVNYAGPVNHTQDHLLDIAKEIQKVWKETADGKLCRQMGAPHGIHSPYHANAIVIKSQLPETKNIPMFAFSIGDVAFIMAPCEMFDTNAKYIRDFSPFKMTFIVTYANEAVSYIPSSYAYIHGCYGADNGRFAPGTGEILANKYLSMLNQLYETKD